MSIGNVLKLIRFYSLVHFNAGIPLSPFSVAQTSSTMETRENTSVVTYFYKEIVRFLSSTSRMKMYVVECLNQEREDLNYVQIILTLLYLFPVCPLQSILAPFHLDFHQMFFFFLYIISTLQG